jgi:hypothetical protein
VKGVRERDADAGERLDPVDLERGFPSPRTRRSPGDADDVPQVDVDLTTALGAAEELNPTRAVDEVEEDELAHLPPAEHPACEATLLRALEARLDQRGLRADLRDRVAVGEALLHRRQA